MTVVTSQTQKSKAWSIDIRYLYKSQTLRGLINKEKGLLNLFDILYGVDLLRLYNMQ